MKFLINECYHKMCESCVDRIFTLGPAPCPVPNCGKVLRKAKFRKQTFEDVHIEREVDIRKRIAKIFNKRASDFPDLRAYNDYLEEVETLTFNLIHHIDLAATEAKLSAYESLNKSSIHANAALAASESAAHSLAIEAERQLHLAAREAAAREIEEEKKELKETRQAMVRALANAKDGEEAKRIVAATEKKIALKRSGVRRAEEEAKLKAARGMAGIKASLLAGKRSQREEEEDNTPFDPLVGMHDTSQYYIVQPSGYDIPWLANFGKETQILAGGYELGEYYERCLFEAFSGLTCLPEDPSSSKSPDVEMVDSAA